MSEIACMIEKSERIPKLIAALYDHMPEIEPYRAEIVSEVYQQTEGVPTITRRARVFAALCDRMPVTIRENELIVGSNSVVPRGCQTFPEYSYEWLEEEFDTVAGREADPFAISEDTKARLKKANAYFKGKTNRELAEAYMSPLAREVFLHHGVFTVGNYFYNGVGHLCVQYDRVINEGYEGIKKQAMDAIAALRDGDGTYARRRAFLDAVVECCDAAVRYAHRYAAEAEKQAAACADPVRRAELQAIAATCAWVPEHPARTFAEACQAFWFVQSLLQLEGSGHSISPGRMDQYLYPLYRQDLAAGRVTPESAQELLDCIWVKLNDLNKVRDAASAEGFAGYGLFQNLIVGGQTPEGVDATNDLSYMLLEASCHVRLPQPSISIRVWNGSPQALLLKAAYLTRLGDGLPAYYNDEVIIPSMMSRGIPLEEARNYCIIGCVEPQVPGKTDGWHDAAFFNMCRPMELVFSNGMDDGIQIGPRTGDVLSFTTFEEFYAAYRKQEAAMIELMVNADNAVDMAHSVRLPLPFESCMVDDCIARGLAVEEGGAHYNFTGPQGFGIANMTDALLAVKTLVFEEHSVTMAEYKEAMAHNFGYGLSGKAAVKATTEIVSSLMQAGVEPTPEQIREIHRQVESGEGIPAQQRERYRALKDRIDALPKYGNDLPEVDYFAREVGDTYTKEVEKYRNPRGGIFQAGLYPVSANVPLGAQTGATPDGRLAYTPIADGVGPASGRDTHGPTATANSVARLDHGVASNGTLFNQKFHPSALAGMAGLNKFVALVRGYFYQKGMHVQYNVVSRETLIDAQNHPENYRNLVVRVAGYSALFTTLSRSLQNDIINRTEQGF